MQGDIKHVEPSHQSQNYLSSTGMCINMELSPKKTKSDSGLSSMSGFSSLEKSPNSPCHKPRIPNAQAQAHLQHLQQQHQQQQQHFLTQIPSYSIPYNNETKALFQSRSSQQDNADKADYMFSEENLNYIRELSKNVPICSVFENKSIFNVDQSQMAHAHHTFSPYQDQQHHQQQQQQQKSQPTQPPPVSPINVTYYKVPDNISYDFPLSETDLNSIQSQRKNYPDMVSVVYLHSLTADFRFVFFFGKKYRKFAS